MDGIGQLAGAPGAAAELTHDAPGLELSVGAFTRGAEPGMSPVGVLLGTAPADRGITRALALPAIGGWGCQMLMPGPWTRSVSSVSVGHRQVIATERNEQSVIN